MQKAYYQIFLATVLTLLIPACSPDQSDPQTTPSPPQFVGSETCASCHQPEFAEWQDSHHQLAMLPATEESVLGDFSTVTVPYFDSSATFFQRNDRFFALAENASGEQQEYEITHTFGVEPLQQYLVDMPGGRKQALQYTWDSRPASAGGQRWYHLYPDEYIGPDDPLHWTGRYFNWNYMCAECHSTDLKMNYDIDSDSFATTFSEISVGCEACHGPASTHIQQADSAEFDQLHGFLVALNERDGAAWIMNPTTGIAERSRPNEVQQEVESCGRCHSRRSVVASDYEYGKHLTDTHMPALLEENLYHSDGRIMEEVYVYGSFVQSKMFAAGVTCSDCHNPHTGDLRAGDNANETCSTCHLKTKYASTEHSEEQIGNCVTCHMPATTYMGVDDRRDHSFRLPHTATDREHYGATIAAGREGSANDKLLTGIANTAFPPIARATMLTLLEPANSAEDRDLLLTQLDDPDPLIRIAALRALRQQVPEFRMSRGSHLLRDPVRSVRIEAAVTYVEFRDLLQLEDGRAFAAAAHEYRQAMTAAANTLEAVLSLADFETRLGNTSKAARLFEHAIRIGSDSATVQHAYGLYLVRSGDSIRALQHLRLATELNHEEPQFAYVYGVALNSLGQPVNAVAVLQSAYDRFPEHFDTGWALATIHRDLGDFEAARLVARQLAEVHEEDRRVADLLHVLSLD